MARVCFVFLVIAAAVLLVESKSRCPKNERWNSCGTACPATCKDPNPGPCTLQCKPGCQCKAGLLRNEDGQCVKKSECSKN